jgi:hypothetical protein
MAKLLSVPVASGAIAIALLSLPYILVQSISLVTIALPISRAVTKLNKSLSQFHRFLILAINSGLSLGLRPATGDYSH